MFYIVWREPFTNYSEQQGDGYFVSYKDKCSDYYSKNWFEAKKYKTIGPALTRLGLNCPRYITSFEKFLELNEINTLSVNRDKLLSEILSEKHEVKFGDFSKGRIDKIDNNGNFLGNADDDIIEYINKIINSNNRKSNLYVNTPGLYEQPKQIGVNSWEGFY